MKKTTEWKKLSCPRHVSFTGATLIFFRHVWKLPSVVNFNCDLSLVIDGAEVHYNFQSEKKTELSISCQFYWCDIYFFRDVCKLSSVVNLDCDLSLVNDGAEVHYNFQSEKRNSKLSISCQFYWCDIYFFRDVCKL